RRRKERRGPKSPWRNPRLQRDSDAQQAAGGAERCESHPAYFVNTCVATGSVADIGHGTGPAPAPGHPFARVENRSRRPRRSLWTITAAHAALGWVREGNVDIVERFADFAVDRLPALAAELVSLQPDVIFTNTSPGTDAATPTIPIVVGADRQRQGRQHGWP